MCLSIVFYFYWDRLLSQTISPKCEWSFVPPWKTLKTETAVHCGGSAGWQGSWQSDLKENTRGRGEKLHGTGWRSRSCRTFADHLKAFVFCSQWIENIAGFFFFQLFILRFLTVGLCREQQRRTVLRFWGIFMSETMMAYSKIVEEVRSDINISWKQSQQASRVRCERRDLKMIPTFLTWAAERLEVPSSEIEKATVRRLARGARVGEIRSLIFNEFRCLSECSFFI